MKTPTLILLISLLSMSPPCRAEDAASRLLAEYEKRRAAALQPVDVWYDNEIKRLNELAQRGTDGTLQKQARQLLMGRFLTTRPWEWNGGGAPFPVTFNLDGTGGSRWATWRWEAISEKDLLLVRDNGQEINFTLGANGIWTASKDFDGTLKKSELRQPVAKKKK